MERQQVLFVDFKKQGLPEDLSVFHYRLTSGDIYRDCGFKQTDRFHVVNFGFSFPWMKRKGFMVAVRFNALPPTKEEWVFITDITKRYAEVSETKLNGVIHLDDYTLLEFIGTERSLMLACNDPIEMLDDLLT